MTQLDFDAKYIPVRHVSREIDELGNSMNELSETLEETISELKTANVSLQQDIEKKEQIDEMRKRISFECFTRAENTAGTHTGICGRIKKNASMMMRRAVIFTVM